MTSLGVEFQSFSDCSIQWTRSQSTLGPVCYVPWRGPLFPVTLLCLTGLDPTILRMLSLSHPGTGFQNDQNGTSTGKCKTRTFVLAESNVNAIDKVTIYIQWRSKSFIKEELNMWCALSHHHDSYLKNNKGILKQTFFC